MDDILQLVSVGVAGLSSKPVFDDWSPDYHARMLELFWSVPVNSIKPIGDLFPTWLRQDNGELLTLEVGKEPWAA